jgi:hypothetical protein
LRPRSPDGRTLSAVEHAKLDAGLVGDDAHQAAERVDLAHDLTFADPTDRGITRHAPDRRPRERDHRGVCAQPGGRPGGLGAGMPTANHQHVIVCLRHCERSRALPGVATPPRSRIVEPR